MINKFFIFFIPMDKSLILQACRTLTQHLLFILVDPLQNKILSKSITKTNTRKLVPNKN